MRDHQMPALRTIALLLVAVWGTNGNAAGLGSIRIQSALGESLRASVPILGNDIADLNATCVKASLEQPDGSFIVGAQTAFSYSGQGTVLHFSTSRPVNEPALALRVEIACGTPIQRTFQVLLDPVISLPQVAVAVAGIDNKRGTQSRQKEQRPIATASSTDPVTPQSVPDKPRLIASSQKAPVQGATEAGVKPALPARAPSDRERKETKKIVRNVLRLSSDDEPIDTMPAFSAGLKLSDTLSESRDTGDPEKAAELQSAHARFAAVLRGEDPVQNGEMQIKAMQSKLQDLEKQMTLIHQQSEQQRQADQAAIATMRRDLFSADWIIGLGALLLSALAAIGWLLWRLQHAFNSNHPAFWEKTIVGDSQDSPEWDETITRPAKNKLPDEEIGLQDDTLHSDWPRGLPLDDTLAVDWAAQQARLQNDSHQQPSARKGHPAAKYSSSESLAADDGQADDPAPSSDNRPDFPRIVSKQPVRKQADAASENNSGNMAGISAVRERIAASNAEYAASKRLGSVNLIQVEEVSNLLQEAEFWMLLNDPERAIDILEPSTNIEKPVSPVPWIYLLDLYQVTNRKEQYEALAVRMKQVFNTHIPGWDNQSNDQVARSLQDYPHVMQAVQDLWEGDYIIPYLESLLFDERDGARAGFDLSVYREIIHLIGVARDPERPKKRAHLNFGKSERRMVSQQLKAGLTPAAASSAMAGEEHEVFDKIMSHQDTSKQVLQKVAVPKLPEQPVQTGAARSLVMHTESVEDGVPSSRAGEVLSFQWSADQGKQDSSNELIAQKPAEVKTIASPVVSVTQSSQQQAQGLKDIIAARRAAYAEQHKEKDAAPIDPASLDAAVKSGTTDISGDELVEEVTAGESARQAEHVADMARKLDLSIAYREIGEHVGARVLLEEVIQGGTPIQVNKAKGMLKKLLQEIDWQ